MKSCRVLNSAKGSILRPNLQQKVTRSLIGSSRNASLSSGFDGTLPPLVGVAPGLPTAEKTQIEPSKLQKMELSSDFLYEFNDEELEAKFVSMDIGVLGLLNRLKDINLDGNLEEYLSQRVVSEPPVRGPRRLYAISILKRRRKKMNKHKWKKARRAVRDSSRYNKEKKRKQGIIRKKQE